MSLRAAVVVISFLAASAVATSTNSDTVVRFRRHLADVPHDWMLEGDAMPHDTARVSFAVSHAAGAVDALLEEYWSRSDPTNSRMYGKWLSKDEIDALVPAHAGAKHAVMTWIAGVLPCATNGTCVVEHSDHIVVTASVRAMGRMFPGMQWHRFRRAGQSLVAAVGECRLPRAVHSALRLVSGLSDFPPHRRALSQRGGDVASAGSSIPYNPMSVVPQVAWRTYGVTPELQRPHPGASQAVIEFTNSGSFNKTSLAQFQEYLDLPATKVDHVVGRYSIPNGAGTEQTLDIQYILGLAPNAPTWYWTSSNWMYEFATTFAAAADVPLVASMSFAWYDSSQCSKSLDAKCTTGETSAAYIAAVDVEFVKIGLRGVTLLAASGDAGAWGQPYPPNDVLNPYYPASSPYVLAVGATQLINSTTPGPGANTSITLPPHCFVAPPPHCGGFQRPVICPQCSKSTTEAPVPGWSGGGFSLTSPTPAYQKAAVDAYFARMPASKLPPTTAYNASNRGYPDVSALGENVFIRIWGSWMSQGGTSAATPMWAGVITMANSARLSHGKSSLGPVNQLMYHIADAHPAALTDMTEGNNRPFQTKYQDLGFYATKGWDPVSGLGTPVVPELVNYVTTQLP